MRASRPAVAAAIAATITAALAAPRPAAAQAAAPAAAQADVRRPDAPATAAILRPAATFRFARRDAAAFPTDVTVADSAGQLVARYRLDGDRVARPMVVTVIDTSLVLQAETPSGQLLTILLDGQNAPSSGPVTGRWWLGEASGALRGRSR
jgi:hypothetical protein